MTRNHLSIKPLHEFTEEDIELKIRQDLFGLDFNHKKNRQVEVVVIEIESRDECDQHDCIHIPILSGIVDSTEGWVKMSYENAKFLQIYIQQTNPRAHVLIKEPMDTVPLSKLLEQAHSSVSSKLGDSRKYYQKQVQTAKAKKAGEKKLADARAKRNEERIKDLWATLLKKHGLSPEVRLADVPPEVLEFFYAAKRKLKL